MTIQYLYQFGLCIDGIKTHRSSKMFFTSKMNDKSGNWSLNSGISW